MSHPHQVAPVIVQQNTAGLIINCAYIADGLRYLGHARPGSLNSDPVWQIQRLDYADGKVVAVRFAANAAFSQVWDNREALVYS